GALGACLPVSSFRPAPPNFPLAKPDSALLAKPGPDSFTVRFATSRGPFDVRVHRDWAPRGSDRIYYLTRAGFYDGVRFFRVVNGANGRPFVAQWGLNGDTAVGRAWRAFRMQDDPAVKSNVRGTLSFAAGGPNTRTTQVYVNFGDNSRLDTLRFAVFGQVIRGMELVVDSLYKGYPAVPSQDSIGRQGNTYLLRSYPKLDHIINARVIQEWRR
ncbi:MAG: peptidylprolyl isomerase, partial [Gemmatimonadota bacterium]|nr:peptidylprolyl isomerase [Gemmatimonadota bacterium]